MSHSTLRDFLMEEMKRREMSMRQFAEFVGVAHTTVTRAVDPVSPPPPSFDFLVKLAKATKTDIRTIAAIVAPDAVIDQSPEVLMLAERISRLTDDQRKLIDAAITGIVFKGS
jgi:transcriptional regulator with XRE-family HTH domain